MLRRSPLLLAVLVSYPLLIALLLALVAGYANAKPRVAFVDDDNLPETVEIGGRTFHVERTIRRVSDDVVLVPLERDEAERQLRNGKVVAIVRVPAGFVAQLKAMQRSPRLELETTRGLLASRVTQQMQALVYSLNRELQDAFIAANLRYVDLILHGGRGNVPRAPLRRARPRTRGEPGERPGGARVHRGRAARARPDGRRARGDRKPDRARDRLGRRAGRGRSRRRSRRTRSRS